MAAVGIETVSRGLKGKREDNFIVELIGGKLRLVPAYTSMSGTITPSEETELLKKLQNEYGYQACKIRMEKVNDHDEDQWPGRTEQIIKAEGHV